jgi:hypothetical protein
MNELQILVEALGIELEKERRSAVLAAFQPVAQEIAKLRSLDLTDVHRRQDADARIRFFICNLWPI